MKHLHLYVTDEELPKVAQLLQDNEVEYEVEAPSADIPEWHKAILNERLDNPNRGPSIPWEEVEKELNKMLDEEF